MDNDDISIEELSDEGTHDSKGPRRLRKGSPSARDRDEDIDEEDNEAAPNSGKKKDSARRTGDSPWRIDLSSLELSAHVQAASRDYFGKLMQNTTDPDAIFKRKFLESLGCTSKNFVSLITAFFRSLVTRLAARNNVAPFSMLAQYVCVSDIMRAAAVSEIASATAPWLQFSQKARCSAMPALSLHDNALTRKWWKENMGDHAYKDTTRIEDMLAVARSEERECKRAWYGPVEGEEEDEEDGISLFSDDEDSPGHAESREHRRPPRSPSSVDSAEQEERMAERDCHFEQEIMAHLDAMARLGAAIAEYQPKHSHSTHPKKRSGKANQLPTPAQALERLNASIAKALDTDTGSIDSSKRLTYDAFRSSEGSDYPMDGASRRSEHAILDQHERWDVASGQDSARSTLCEWITSRQIAPVWRVRKMRLEDMDGPRECAISGRAIAPGRTCYIVTITLNGSNLHYYYISPGRGESSDAPRLRVALAGKCAYTVRAELATYPFVKEVASVNASANAVFQRLQDNFAARLGPALRAFTPRLGKDGIAGDDLSDTADRDNTRKRKKRSGGGGAHEFLSKVSVSKPKRRKNNDDDDDNDDDEGESVDENEDEEDEEEESEEGDYEYGDFVVPDNEEDMADPSELRKITNRLRTGRVSAGDIAKARSTDVIAIDDDDDNNDEDADGESLGSRDSTSSAECPDHFHLCVDTTVVLVDPSTDTPSSAKDDLPEGCTIIANTALTRVIPIAIEHALEEMLPKDLDALQQTYCRITDTFTAPSCTSRLLTMCKDRSTSQDCRGWSLNKYAAEARGLFESLYAPAEVLTATDPEMLESLADDMTREYLRSRPSRVFVSHDYIGFVPKKTPCGAGKTIKLFIDQLAVLAGTEPTPATSLYNDPACPEDECEGYLYTTGLADLLACVYRAERPMAPSGLRFAKRPPPPAKPASM
jgi:hypothetical protein